MYYGDFSAEFEVIEGFNPVCTFKTWRTDFYKEAARLLGVTEKFMNKMKNGRVIQKFVEPKELADSNTPVRDVVNYPENTKVKITLVRLRGNFE